MCDYVVKEVPTLWRPREDRSRETGGRKARPIPSGIGREQHNTRRAGRVQRQRHSFGSVVRAGATVVLCCTLSSRGLEAVGVGVGEGVRGARVTTPDVRCDPALCLCAQSLPQPKEEATRAVCPPTCALRLATPLLYPTRIYPFLLLSRGAEVGVPRPSSGLTCRSPTLDPSSLAPSPHLTNRLNRRQRGWV